jgi:putative protease
MKALELLAPARDMECGKAAVNHGADAVYIGGPAFGARAAAGNPMADIEKLALYSHRYRARVYLTLNTILFDDELERARTLAYEAWDAGVDALIIQDMGMLELDLPPLPLIASTQMNNVSPDHVLFLEKVGFQRVILAGSSPWTGSGRSGMQPPSSWSPSCTARCACATAGSAS